MGPRGAGKTTIARHLADAWGVPMVDTDDLCLARFNATSVRTVWQTFGEPAWRAAEGDVIESLLASPEHNLGHEHAGATRRTASPSVGNASGRLEVRQVIALGGGAPTVERAAHAIRAAQAARRAFVVYLRATPEVLAARLTGETADRPPLLSKSGHPPVKSTVTGPNKNREGTTPQPHAPAVVPDEPALQEVAAVLALRDPLYRDLADAVINTGDRSVPEIARQIVKVFGAGHRGDSCPNAGRNC